MKIQGASSPGEPAMRRSSQGGSMRRSEDFSLEVIFSGYCNVSKCLYSVMSMSPMSCLCRMFLKEHGLEGKMEPGWIKQKWENLKQKYKHCNGNIRSKHQCCKSAPEGVPGPLEWLVGFNIIPVITIIPVILVFDLRLQDVPIPEADVVQEKAGTDDFRHKLHLGFQENGAPPGLEDPKCPLHEALCPGQAGVVPALHRIPDRLPEWHYQADGLCQARVSAIAQQTPSRRWVQPVDIEGAAPQDLGIMDAVREAHHHIQKVTLVVADGLELDRVEQLPVVIVRCKQPRWNNADMAAINAPCYPPKGWGARQLLEPGSNLLQLFGGGGRMSLLKTPWMPLLTRWIMSWHVVRGMSKASDTTQ
ncbi:hypothetical protein GJAV_G00141680 [Gymnothorax javanicus]|nr:hypothetical protein GJAV_G00141680 [Gymnothorax javanicus]